MKIDEDLPQQIAELFTAHAHDATTLVGQGWCGLLKMFSGSENESRRAYLELVASALERLELDDSVGAVVVVTPHGLRIRRSSKQ